MIARSILPILTVLSIILAVWYGGAVAMNWRIEAERFERMGLEKTTMEMVQATMAMDRPVLPAPHQVWVEFQESVFERNPSSPRSLVFHAWITLSSSLVGFAMGTLLGILLAVGIVHSKVLDKSLLPWIIASQTIPILAIAPMIIIVFSTLGVQGLIPKAFISTYLAFFPVAIGMTKGLRSPEAMHLDLMHTYNATRSQTFWKLRLPASLPYLFASMKIAVAISLVGAIVGELPTGAQGGIGARLLNSSYYGQTIQIWAALFAAAFMSALLVYAIGWIGAVVNKRMGAREAAV
ncbi:MAG: ABC transporter permease [Rhizobiales bacterium]|nr:ABC transporter permease [Hyphomicrobiales bacterium]MBO6697308.1 ABC transporter permease [Hyphomicrobiales bacterium]MBO6736437.1 ABC transporter permease [Hyphomicrobiales bacterium]MBO6912907.1 ABC transporter permease [Hyphomicrobiales bacterium]MBO6954075.1 ABC transporter permease [Hyphomicrobiales bacterium]